MARKGMTSEQAIARWYKANEFRLAPGDEQQIEYRKRGSDDDWKPYAFYDNVDRAREVLESVSSVGNK